VGDGGIGANHEVERVDERGRVGEVDIAARASTCAKRPRRTRRIAYGPWLQRHERNPASQNRRGTCTGTDLWRVTKPWSIARQDRPCETHTGAAMVATRLPCGGAVCRRREIPASGADVIDTDAEMEWKREDGGPCERRIRTNVGRLRDNPGRRRRPASSGASGA
jgi:hypothetical protein